MRARRFPRAIDLKIAQDQRAFPVSFQENERIGRKEARRIKHVRVVFARSDDQFRLAFGFTHCVFLYS